MAQLTVLLKPIRFKVRLYKHGVMTTRSWPMADLVILYENDLLPELTIDVYDYDPDTLGEIAMDLSAEDTVIKFYLKNDTTGILKIDGVELTAIDAETGSFKYTWLEGDTDTVGEYTGELRLTYPSDKTRTIARFKLEIIEGV